MERIDTDRLSDRELAEAYVHAAMAAVLTKHPVRQVFGSRRHSGWLFGRQVPGLVVLDDEGRAVDVFPHQEGKGRVEIADYLRARLKGLGTESQRGSARPVPRGSASRSGSRRHARR